MIFCLLARFNNLFDGKWHKLLSHLIDSTWFTSYANLCHPKWGGDLFIGWWDREINNFTSYEIVHPMNECHLSTQDDNIAWRSIIIIIPFSNVASCFDSINRCFPSCVFQHSLPNCQWTWKNCWIISFGEAASTCCNGFHSWCAICQ